MSPTRERIDEAVERMDSMGALSNLKDVRRKVADIIQDLLCEASEDVTVEILDNGDFRFPWLNRHSQ